MIFSINFLLLADRFPISLDYDQGHIIAVYVFETLV